MANAKNRTQRFKPRTASSLLCQIAQFGAIALGGPAIDMDKMGVVGVNSRSFDGMDNYCIVSWLGRALDVPFRFDDVEFRTDRGEAIPVKNTTLRHLAQQGVVSIV